MEKSLYNPTRPIESIERILAHFPPSKPFLLDSGKVLVSTDTVKNSSSAKTFFLLDGTMMFCMGSGEKKQNFFLGLSPNIMNIDSATFQHMNFSLESVTPCLIDSIPQVEFKRILTENNLWQDMAEITASRLQAFAMRAMTAGMQTSYEIIRSYLIYLETETTHNLKERYTVIRFMQTFTRLSRSMILRVLSELKSGEFIELDNGKLVRICRPLPERF